PGLLPRRGGGAPLTRPASRGRNGPGHEHGCAVLGHDRPVVANRPGSGSEDLRILVGHLGEIPPGQLDDGRLSSHRSELSRAGVAFASGSRRYSGTGSLSPLPAVSSRAAARARNSARGSVIVPCVGAPRGAG